MRRPSNRILIGALLLLALAFFVYYSFAFREGNELPDASAPVAPSPSPSPAPQCFDFTDENSCVNNNCRWATRRGQGFCGIRL